MSEALSSALHKEVQDNVIEELKISWHAPGVSHLLFADDALVFFKASTDQAGKIKSLLNHFEKGMGQQLSPTKCSLLTRESLDDQRKEEIRELLGVERVDFEPKYLGLPTPKGRMKKSRFQPLRERLGKRLAAWTEKHLSAAAKEVLIKAVAQATNLHNEYLPLISNVLRGADKGNAKLLVGSAGRRKENSLDCLG